MRMVFRTEGAISLDNEEKAQNYLRFAVGMKEVKSLGCGRKTKAALIGRKAPVFQALRATAEGRKEFTVQQKHELSTGSCT